MADIDSFQSPAHIRKISNSSISLRSTLNPIALGKAKIAYFGLSECTRVKEKKFAPQGENFLSKKTLFEEGICRSRKLTASKIVTFGKYGG